jgi:protein involved in polysaccharide export with SLBB domain
MMTKKLVRIGLSGLILLWCFCQVMLVSFSIDPAMGARIEYVSDAYRVGAGDVLSVSVIPQQEYGGTGILVRADGMASFPGVGELFVAGQTLHEVQQAVTAQLTEWIRDPNPVITVTHPRSATIYLSGAVLRPGSFQMMTNLGEHGGLQTPNQPPLTRVDMVLSNVLANAGGVLPVADLSRIEVRRRDSGEVVRVNLWQVLKAGMAEEDIWLNPGDSVHIPELPVQAALSDEEYEIMLRSTLAPDSIPVRVMGAVTTPTTVELDGQSPLLSTAISRAGGFTESAARKKVVIRRFTQDKRFSTLTVEPHKMDFVLRPNDLVYVGENRVYLAGRLMQQAAAVLAPIEALMLTTGGAAQTFGFGGWRNFRSGF